jgi:8-oxo-dGTP diphosphatase
LQKNSTVIPVVAAALIGGDGRILLQRRRLGGEHGGLWEFPGGKIDPGESPESALIREIEEELAVRLDPGSLVPVAFASDPALPPAPRAPYVILLYMCRAWAGGLRCLDGEEIAWFAPGEILDLAMPPLDVPLARALIATI